MVKAFYCSECDKYFLLDGYDNGVYVSVTIKAAVKNRWFEDGIELYFDSDTLDSSDEKGIKDSAVCSMGHQLTYLELTPETCPHPEWEEDLRPAGRYWGMGGAMGQTYADFEDHPGPYRECTYCGLEQDAVEETVQEGNTLTKRWVFTDRKEE